MSAGRSSGYNGLCRSAGTWALLLDVDGTLLELAQSPGAVRVSARLRNALLVAGARESGALALFTGRPIAEIDELFYPRQFPAAGVHGLERRGASGHIHRVAADGSMGARARAAFTDFAKTHAGIVVEDKGAALAVHYRRALHWRGAVTEFALGLAAQLGTECCVEAGKSVIELRPVASTKGAAIKAFMCEAPFAGRVPVYVGDDELDEEGFAVVNDLGGMSIRVGFGGPTRARWQLASVSDVIRWLVAPDPRLKRCLGHAEPLRVLSGSD